MRINLSKTPSFPQTYHTEFPNLDGGLNLRELGYLVASNESPCMKNLVWRNGILQSRDGQKKVAKVFGAEDAALGLSSTGYAAYTDLFHGYAFFHVGNRLMCLDMRSPLPGVLDPSSDSLPEASAIPGSQNVPQNKGAFFRYQDGLYYKNEGGFYRIAYDEDNPSTAFTREARFEMHKKPTAWDYFDIYVYTGQTAPTEWKFELYTGAPTLSNLQYKYVILQNKQENYLLTADHPPVYAPTPVDNAITIDASLYSGFSGFVFCVYQGTDVTQILLQGSDPWHSSDSYGYLTADLGDEGLVYSSYGGPGDADSVPTPEMCWTLNRSSLGVVLRNASDRWWNCKLSYTPGYSVPSLPFRSYSMVDYAMGADNAPVIVVNAAPSTGSGTMYQPENRLSFDKTVWYNADGTAKYQLPVDHINSIVRVLVDGEEKEIARSSGGTIIGGDYTVNHTTGEVTFLPGHIPAAGTNNVQITYRKANTAALLAILDCKYAMVASGGEAAQYIVLGGNDTQPDAIFWNANDELAIQPWYFPMPCYNLVGTAGDPVTGFGRQYNDTLVFSDHTVGKLTYGTQEIDGRLYPAFGYARVNSKIGCDLPWTIQQVENNVVFCNTYSGAHIVLSSSAAYENNIEQLSTKINEPRHEATGDIPGLLADIAASTTDVVSYDDDERYWICANGKVYVWDYEISTYAKPSWLYWENIYPAALFRDDRHNPYHLGHDGYITAYLPGLLSDDVLDDGDIVQEAIEKVYRFPTLHFGSYDRLKDVVRLLLAVRSDVPSTIRVWYETDYEKREDQTPVVVQPINAPGQSNLHVQVARRNPGCRHVRQFSLTLTNDVPGEELALVSAEVYHRFTGPER